MLTRNVLSVLAATPSTEDVLLRVYDSVVLPHPTQDRVIAYIAKGIDVDEDGWFEPSTEYNQWREPPIAATPLEVTVYYDFNGVRWHDGTQVTVWDLLFSYHVAAWHPRWNNSIRALFCNPTATYEACGRQLRMTLSTKFWEGEGVLPGDPNLRAAVRFSLAEPFARFPEQTLRPLLLPMHVWSRTGGGRHTDFGCAIWIPPNVASAKKLPECGTTFSIRWGMGIDPGEPVPGSKPHSHLDAVGWSVRDGEVVGHGPFKFATWVSGVQASVVRNEEFYVGKDPATETLYDSRLAGILRKPAIEGIRFLVYKTTQLLVFALEEAEIDVIRGPIGPEFVPRLPESWPDIGVEANADPGFAYMAYNFRREPWGYRNGNASDDAGYWFRQALSHVIDKRSFCSNLLQNFCAIGSVPVSPANTFWYNDDVPKPTYELAQAASILDAHGFGPDPPGACDRNNPTGCRSLPRIGQNEFWVVTPQADSDPVLASAGAMIADAMRQVGINANSRPMPLAEIMIDFSTAQYRRDFDVLILDWEIYEIDPDYFFRFFHSTNAPAGDNYPGIANASMNTALDDSRRAADSNPRREAIFRAQEVFADVRPYEVLYYRTNIEGYRNDRFANWTARFGTIWNYWSLIGIRPPSSGLPPGCFIMDVPSATGSGALEQILVTVCDDQGARLPGAAVVLSVSHGTVEVGAYVGSSVAGTTNANGELLADFRAPAVDVETSVFLTAAVSHSRIRESVRTSTIVVFPPGGRFLSLRLGLPLGDHVTAGSELPMTIDVRDEERTPIGDATITVESSDRSQLQAIPSDGPAANMTRITLDTTQVTTAVSVVQVVVRAVKAGYPDGTAAVAVTIVPDTHVDPICPDGSRLLPDGSCPSDSRPMPSWIPLVAFAAVGSSIVVAIIVLQARRHS